MNRRTEMFDDRIADWLEDDPVQAPPQVLETVVAAVPSIPQRRAGLVWPRRPMESSFELAAALAAVVVAGVLGLLLLSGPSIGPKVTPTTPAGLTNRIDVPLHYFAISLPPGWDAALATGSGRPDTFQGPEGSITATFSLIPAGSGQDAWADTEFVDRMSRRGGNCAGFDPATYQPVRVGSDSGRFYIVPCWPEWIAMAAVGDRGFTFEFAIRGGTSSDVALRLFKDILAGMTFDSGATPALDLTPFTSTRYGYSSGYPTGWTRTEAVQDLRAFDIPWFHGDAADVFTGSGVGGPGQPSDGELDLAATTVPAGTTMQELISKTAGIECGAPSMTEDVTVDGKRGTLVRYWNCNGDYQLWVLVLDGTRAYHLLWVNYPGSEGFDRTVFLQVLSTFRFPTDIPTPSASQKGAPSPTP